MAQAVLINVVEVPNGRDEELLGGRNAGRRSTERQPDDAGTTLHRRLAPQVRFRSVNVAMRESAESVNRALHHPELAAHRGRLPVAHSPSVYAVVQA